MFSGVRDRVHSELMVTYHYHNSFRHKIDEEALRSKPTRVGVAGREEGLRAAGDQPILVSVLLLLAMYLLGKENFNLFRCKPKSSLHHLTLLT